MTRIFKYRDNIYEVVTDNICVFKGTLEACIKWVEDNDKYQ
jgi:hypothetical protein